MSEGGGAWPGGAGGSDIGTTGEGVALCRQSGGMCADGHFLLDKQGPTLEAFQYGFTTRSSRPSKNIVDIHWLSVLRLSGKGGGSGYWEK